MKKFMGLCFVAVGLLMGGHGVVEPFNAAEAALGVLAMLGGLTAVWSYEREVFGRR